MKHSRLALFGAVLLVLLLVIGECKSRKQQAETSPSPRTTSSDLVPLAPTATPSPSATPAQAAATPPIDIRSADFRKVAERIRPAVISISAFDTSGKLRRTGTGFFVSEDGRFVTSRSVLDGAANAVAKTNDGRIFNVSGILAEDIAVDLAIVRAEVKDPVAPLLTTKAALPEPGAPVAVIASSLARREASFLEGTISARSSDPTGEWFELSMPIPSEAAGSPVVNEKGETIGVVTSQRGKGTAVNVVRAPSALVSLMAKVSPDAKTRWLVAQSSPTPSPGSPGEGPQRKTGQSKLIYHPAPAYPTAARHVHFAPAKGSGRYRITFAANGNVKNVQIIQSTRNDTLDSAAIDTLRKWKAEPGAEWSANVPISFQP